MAHTDIVIYTVYHQIWFYMQCLLHLPYVFLAIINFNWRNFQQSISLKRQKNSLTRNECLRHFRSTFFLHFGLVYLVQQCTVNTAQYCSICIILLPNILNLQTQLESSSICKQAILNIKLYFNKSSNKQKYYFQILPASIYMPELLVFLSIYLTAR